jgi:hypothetical protein
MTYNDTRSYPEEVAQLKISTCQRLGSDPRPVTTNVFRL